MACLDVLTSYEHPSGHTVGRLLLTAAVLLVLSGCGSRVYQLSGQTMGTTFHIKVVARSRSGLIELQKAIMTRLEQIEQSMSTFRPDSEISRFNRLAAGRPFHPSSDFRAVLQVARRVYRLSRGAWDGTVKPLVDLWGFNADRVPEAEPSAGAIARALESIGFDEIQFLPDGSLRKAVSTLHLDLASIAKGYGVDQVAKVIRSAGYENFLVEIGGEVRAAGQRPDGNLWKVGINRPSSRASAVEVIYAVQLRDESMATSGNYRRFFRIGDKTYAHIIDPRSGYPCQNGVLSASVIAPGCTLADGLATALMVLGPGEGIKLVESLPGVEAMLITSAGKEQKQLHRSKGFPASADF